MIKKYDKNTNVDMQQDDLETAAEAEGTLLTVEYASAKTKKDKAAVLQRQNNEAVMQALNLGMRISVPRSSFTFRRAEIKDLEQISHLMTFLHTDATFEELLEENKHFIEKGIFIVAETLVKSSDAKILPHREIIGYAFGLIRTDYVEDSLQWKDPKVGYIESLFVLPEYRKQGVARQLCRLLEQWAISQGATEVASDAYMDNTQSRDFHKAIGFTESKPIIHFIKKIGGED